MPEEHHSKRQKLERAAHIAAGVVILLKGFTAGEHQVTVAVFLYVFGVLFLAVAAWHHRISVLTTVLAHRILFVLEGTVLLAVSYEMVAEHKHYVLYAYLVAAVAYYALAVVFPRIHERKLKRA